MPSDVLPIKRPMHARPVGLRAPPFRGGRAHPLATKKDDTDEQQGINAQVLAQRRARKAQQT